MKEKKTELTKTYAQYDKTHYFVNVLLPDSQKRGFSVLTDKDKVSINDDVLVKMGFNINYEIIGNANQMVRIGSAMEPVTVNISGDKTVMMPYGVSVTRPSRVKISSKNHNLSLTIDGTPTSNDDVVLLQPISKNSCEVNYGNKNNVTFTTGGNGTYDNRNNDGKIYFTDEINLRFVPNDGYRFPETVSLDDIIIEPAEMKNMIASSNINSGVITITWANKHASEYKDFTITVPNVEPATYSVNVIIPAGVECTTNNLNQSVTIGQSMKQIDLRVTGANSKNSGFLPVYHNTSKDGVSVNVDTSGTAPYKNAWVSGTPLRNTQITVGDIIKGAKLNVVLPSDGSVLVKSGEESRLDQFIESGRTMGVVTLVPATNYHMDQEWKKQIQVTPVNDHIVITTSEHETQISGTIVDDTVVTIPSGLRNHTQFVKVNLGANLSLVEGGVSTSGIPMQLIRNRVKAKDGYYLPNDYSVSMTGDTSTGFSETKYRSASEVIYETQMDKCDITVTFPTATAIPRDGLFLTIGESSTRYGWDSQVSPVYGDLRMPMIYSWPAICLWCDKLNNGNYRIEMRASNNPTSSGNRIAVSFLLGSDGAPSTATFFKNFKVENGIGIWWTEESGDRLGNIYKYLQTRNGKVVEVLLADYEAQIV